MKSQLPKSYLFFIILFFISITFQSFRNQNKPTNNNRNVSILDFYDWIIKPGKDQVVVLVNQDVYEQLKSGIEQYKSDVEANFTVQLNIVQGGWTKPEEIRATIKDLCTRRNISGVVLVGAIPMHRFYTQDITIPNLLYYEAFDMQFIEKNGDGIYEEYSMYDRILHGDYLGIGYLAGKKAGEQEMYNDYPNGEIVSGVTLIGNPCIYINPKK